LVGVASRQHVYTPAEATVRLLRLAHRRDCSVSLSQLRKNSSSCGAHGRATVLSPTKYARRSQPTRWRTPRGAMRWCRDPTRPRRPHQPRKKARVEAQRDEAEHAPPDAIRALRRVGGKRGRRQCAGPQPHRKAPTEQPTPARHSIRQPEFGSVHRQRDDISMWLSRQSRIQCTRSLSPLALGTGDPKPQQANRRASRSAHLLRRRVTYQTWSTAAHR
jgi:hypothetical protein